MKERIIAIVVLRLFLASVVIPRKINSCNLCHCAIEIVLCSTCYTLLISKISKCWLIPQVVKDLIKLLSSLKSLKRELRVEKGKSVIHQVKSQKE